MKAASIWKNYLLDFLFVELNIQWHVTLHWVLRCSYLLGKCVETCNNISSWNLSYKQNKETIDKQNYIRKCLAIFVNFDFKSHTDNITQNTGTI